MIRIARGPEPSVLPPIRTNRLSALRLLGRDPVSKEIDGYKIVSDDLWRSQFHKCCYCERRIPKGYNDVEHFRPKAEADRRPGSIDGHGYWWLAFTWENLLFSCPDCNRSYKKTKFPLAPGALALIAESTPPGGEQPMLLDPSAVVNPVEHIQFEYLSPVQRGTRHWWARPRSNSSFGNMTIDVCGLNRLELRELRQDHYLDVVRPHSIAINSAAAEKDGVRLRREFLRALDLLRPRNEFVGLTYYALRAEMPHGSVKELIGASWPDPQNIA